MKVSPVLVLINWLFWIFMRGRARAGNVAMVKKVRIIMNFIFDILDSMGMMENHPALERRGG